MKCDLKVLPPKDAITARITLSPSVVEGLTVVNVEFYGLAVTVAVHTVELRDLRDKEPDPKWPAITDAARSAAPGGST